MPSPDPADVVRGFVPAGPPQAEARDRILGFLDAHPDALLRSCADGHLTGSALVVSADHERVLLMHHRKLGLWLQTGGHADGDADLARVALGEAVEESGIPGLRLAGDGPVDLDVHLVDGGGERAHLHLDVRYVAVAPPGAVPTANHESLELRWFTPAEAAEVATDASTLRLIHAGLAALASVRESPPP